MDEKLSTGYSLIKNELKIFLSEFGFKPYKAAILYRTTENDLLQFLHLQKGAGCLSDQMTINIVQQGLFVPGCNFDLLQPGNRIGQFVNAEKDKWWPFNDGDKVNDDIIEIKEILLKYVLPFYDFSKEDTNLYDLINSSKYNFTWWMPTTFVDKGYFFLKAKLYHEAVEWWEKHQWSKVPRFKTIKKLIQENQYIEVDEILKNNSNIASAKMKI